VSSPYEAAAELLAEHPLALVIDMRCLTPGDLPLVEMARQRDLEVLAVGSLPFGVCTADLSGVRLTARGDLSASLRDLSAGLGRAAAPVVDVPRAGPVGEVRPPRPEAEAPEAQVEESPHMTALAQWVIKASRVGQDAAETPPTENEKTNPAPARDQNEHKNEQKDEQKDEKLPDRPGELLTSEELAALLEDRP